jgi:hypothetical protein
VKLGGGRLPFLPENIAQNVGQLTVALLFTCRQAKAPILTCYLLAKTFHFCYISQIDISTIMLDFNIAVWDNIGL